MVASLPTAQYYSSSSTPATPAYVAPKPAVPYKPAPASGSKPHAILAAAAAPSVTETEIALETSTKPYGGGLPPKPAADTLYGGGKVAQAGKAYGGESSTDTATSESSKPYGGESPPDTSSTSYGGGDGSPSGKGAY